MFWTARDANSITALRCSYLNSRFGNYWESHSPAFGLQCPSLSLPSGRPAALVQWLCRPFFNNTVRCESG
jgi:hypothetical protein